jgi:hypothetical protein
LKRIFDKDLRLSNRLFTQPQYSENKLMFPLPTTCHICGQKYHVTEVQCGHCHTTVSGQFALGRLHQLTPEQLDFIEIFIACEGKINRVEQELNLSYPAVRSRLHDVIRALGREVGENGDNGHAGLSSEKSSPSPAATEARREILARVSAGELSAQDAAVLLREQTA